MPFCSGCGATLSAVTPVQSIMIPQNQETAYAGFWLRFLAYVMDSIVAVFASVAVWIPVAFLAGIQLNLQKAFVLNASFVIPFLIIWLMLILFPWLYFTIFESSSWQATPGKRMAGLLVTDTNGARIGFGKANIRYWSKILSGFVMIGYIMAAFTEKKQALHDMIAGTLVLRR